jgi:GH24 family phage-related lysozyme (muramidase)
LKPYFSKSGPLLIAILAAAALAAGAAFVSPRANPGSDQPASGLFGFLGFRADRLPPPVEAAPDSLHLANAHLVVNENGLEVIRRSEGLRLRSYRLAGQWLIGYGHAASAGPDMVIDEQTANQLLIADVRAAERAVRMTVAMPLTENEFAALVSLAYNIGEGAFARTEVVRRLNAGDRAGAAEAFGYLVTARIDGARVKLAALERRRAAERALFLAPILRA